MIKALGSSPRKLILLLLLMGMLGGAIYWALSYDRYPFAGEPQEDQSIVDLMGEDSVEPAPVAKESTISATTKEKSPADEEPALTAIDPDGRLKEALDEIAGMKAGWDRPSEPQNEGNERSGREILDTEPRSPEGGELFNSNSGLLFFYRLKWDGVSTRKIPVFLNDKPLAQLERGSFLAFPCSLEIQEVFSEMELQRVRVSVSHGETYCLNVYTGMLGKGGVRLIPLDECRKQIEGLAPQFALEPIPIRFE